MRKYTCFYLNKSTGISHLTLVNKMLVSYKLLNILITNFSTFQGMDKVEGLILDFSTSTNKYCNAKMFERLRNLRLLKFVDVHGIRGDLMNTSSFPELRGISWNHCPWTCLPSSLSLQKLVLFDMPSSRFETLWTKDVQV